MFDLKSINRTRRIEAPKMVISGEVKVGKSSFAAGAPSPIFIQTESGLTNIDTSAFPLAESLDDVYSAIGALHSEAHDFKTVVLDSADWTESLVNKHVCKANGWKDIEGPGFGKGYVAAAAEWRQLLDGLESLRINRGMAVIVICHVRQRRVESPTHEGYDAMQLKCNDRVSSLLNEWADILGYAAHRVALKKTDAGFGAKENKAIQTGERVLHIAPHPAYPSGSRFGLQDCPLNWSAFADQLTQAQQPTLKAA